MSQIPLADVIEPATSLASIDDQVARPCFFEAQEVGGPLNEDPVGGGISWRAVGLVELNLQQKFLKEG